jgi:hypothetical protein
MNLFSLTADQLNQLTQPGVYEIYCHGTRKSYFGETTSLIERWARHYPQFQQPQPLSPDAPQLHQDWITYGARWCALRKPARSSRTSWNYSTDFMAANAKKNHTKSASNDYPEKE